MIALADATDWLVMVTPLYAGIPDLVAERSMAMARLVSVVSPSSVVALVLIVPEL